MATIKIPTPLRVYTGGEALITVDGETVGAILDDLVTRYPDLEQHLFKDGELRSFVHVFLGDDNIRSLDGLDTPITEDVALRIVPSIAGG